MTTDKSLHLLSRSRMDGTIDALQASIATIVFMIPIGLLARPSFSYQTRLVIVMSSIASFPIIIRWFSRLRAHELVLMTAAYAAVLVVFIGLNNN